MKVGLSICIFFSSELAGSTPHTVRCNIKVGLTICRFSFSSELVGGRSHTVRCSIEVGLTICSFFFSHLNWRVAHLIQSDVTLMEV